MNWSPSFPDIELQVDQAETYLKWSFPLRYEVRIPKKRGFGCCLLEWINASKSIYLLLLTYYTPELHCLFFKKKKNIWRRISDFFFAFLSDFRDKRKTCRYLSRIKEKKERKGLREVFFLFFPKWAYCPGHRQVNPNHTRVVDPHFRVRVGGLTLFIVLSWVFNSIAFGIGHLQMFPLQASLFLILHTLLLDFDIHFHPLFGVGSLAPSRTWPTGLGSFYFSIFYWSSYSSFLGVIWTRSGSLPIESLFFFQ